MRRPAVLVASVMLVLGLSACNGDSDEPQATPEPTETTPTGPPPQPEGKYGVTYTIQNWDEHYDDEAVVAWKQSTEAMAGSINTGKLTPEFRSGYAKGPRDDYVEAFNYATERDMKLPEQGDARIDKAETSESTAALEVCTWAPTTDYVNDEGSAEEIWRKYEVSMEVSDGRWVITEEDLDGECSGEAPS